MRNQADRSEDIQQAQRQLEQNDLKSALDIVLRLLAENPYEYVEDHLKAGRRDQSRDDLQDFDVDQNDGAIHCREIYLQEIGDPPEFALGRVGPDNVPFNYEQLKECPSGTPGGLIYWRFWDPDNSWSLRYAQIHVRKADGRGGDLTFATSAPNGPPPYGALIDRLTIDHNGVYHFQNVMNAIVNTVNGEIQIPVTVNEVPMWLVFKPRS